MRLEEGDVILFPQGDPHVMSSAPGLRAEVVDVGVYFAPRPPQLPYSISYGEPGVTTARLDGGGRDTAPIVCGFLGCDARPYNPLLAARPRVLRMPGAAGGQASWVAIFLRSAVDESNRKRPGGEAVLERMSERLFVEVLRRYVDALPPGQTGWLAGMRDPGVGRALALLHQRPSEPWTLEQLGDEAGLSRSVLHDRFGHFIGQPPMQYLARWRMQLAAAPPGHRRQAHRDRARRRVRERGGLLAGVPPGGGGGPRCLASRAAGVGEGARSGPRMSPGGDRGIPRFSRLPESPG